MSETISGAAVVAHGGGPTQVINASLAGVIEERRGHPEITALYGARHGILGVLNEDLLDLDQQDREVVEAIGHTPGSALGSCRRKVSSADFERILAVFRAHNVRYFFYNGGNDSMDTAAHVARLAAETGYDLRVIGIPKTIDNDLAETDHCPGYGSAARFIACALRDIGADIRELPSRVTVVEVMGRNAGWLVAATALARKEPDDPPQLIYLPEHPISAEQFLADVEGVHRRLGHAVIAVCEGQTDDKGEPFGADMVAADGFQHQLTGNLAHVLAQLITRRLKLRARSEKPGLLGRSSMAFISATDQAEARLCGQAAVRAAVSGLSGLMVTLVREPDGPYRVRTGLAPLEKVANAERLLPAAWIHKSGHDVTRELLEYVSPLAGEIEPRPRLRKALAVAKL
jgi:ATP-dependent phosphofructokinase / diphosphate-dependent phosphofructokinase